MSTRIRDITKALEDWAPLSTAESFDNSGLQLGRPDREVPAAVIALDLTPAVIAEAKALDASLIITHHPLFFAPIKSISPQTLVGSMALSLAENGIAHYAIHTNLDKALGGVSFALAKQLGLGDLRFLASDEDDAGHGLGAIGTLKEPLYGDAFLRYVSESMGLESLRHVSDPNATVATVAVCGGSGSSFLETALRAGADAYVTADVKYHQFFDALDPDGKPRIAYLDIGHYESEAVTEGLLIDFLAARFPEVVWSKTEEATSPVRSFVP